MLWFSDNKFDLYVRYMNVVMYYVHLGFCGPTEFGVLQKDHHESLQVAVGRPSMGSTHRRCLGNKGDTQESVPKGKMRFCTILANSMQLEEKRIKSSLFKKTKLFIFIDFLLIYK